VRFLHRLLLLACAIPAFDCGSDGADGAVLPPPEKTTQWSTPDGRFSVSVEREPFALSVRDGAGTVLVEGAGLEFTHNQNLELPTLLFGFDHYRGEDGPWKRALSVVAVERKPDKLTFRLSTDDGTRGAQLTFEGGAGLHITSSVDTLLTDTEENAINRLSLAFRMHDDDHFFGFGERFVDSDQRGYRLTTWVEDGGMGSGEAVAPSDTEPFPSGRGQTNAPIPWFMSPRGFGLLQNTTFRTTYHLGDEHADSWRVEAADRRWDATLFADADPNKLVESLTEVTGRPPKVADWVLAPRRRGNIGSDEMQKLRAAHVPTSVIDTAMHYFPNGTDPTVDLKAVTADIHKRGFKAIAYFCPFIADSWHPVFEEARDKGYLVKKHDGAPYVVLDPPYTAAMVDFTNPDAFRWYQGHLKVALDDGWDGWMYDFSEYVPQDAVFFNGMRGYEGHNLYPVLYQRAAFELLERERPGDYLIFVRAAYSGTGGLTPMVWAGDQSTDFSRTDGLPAALTGALNAGMSGLPLWGSDISGYHYIFTPPPDKELYLRWTELGAFSADMHDENEGNGKGPNSDRWQIWKDEESVRVYRKYAGLKTRMIPYVRAAVEEARSRGTPVMRHLYLSYPRDPKVYGMADEYMFGSSLLVAPVVTRGQQSRNVYLPEDAYYDFFTGARVAGKGDHMVDAPLDAVPVFAKPGAIVPLYAEDVETLIPAADGSVVSLADRANELEVRVFAGGESSFTLPDGTIIEQRAPRDTFEPSAPEGSLGPLPVVNDAGELTTCGRCAFRAPGARSWIMAIAEAGEKNPGETRDETITMGALTLALRRSPSVKRYRVVVCF
jgi:alpha-glucosidase